MPLICRIRKSQRVLVGIYDQGDGDTCFGDRHMLARIPENRPWVRRVVKGRAKAMDFNDGDDATTAGNGTPQ